MAEAASDTYQVNIDANAVYKIYGSGVSRSTASGNQVTIKNEGTKTAWISTSSEGTTLTSGLTADAVGTVDMSKGFSLAAGAQYIRPGRAALYAICGGTDTTTLSIDVIRI
jgi:hypothetical protein